MKIYVLFVLIAILLVACASTATAVPATAIPPQAATAPSAATVAPANTSGLDGATIVSTNCAACHNSDRIKQAKKTRAQWEQTVDKMIGKGAKLTDAEKSVLLDYLAKTYGQ
ncbi:MAG TPA: hypothetical protein VF338_10925 [Leptolinea sp.]